MTKKYEITYKNHKEMPLSPIAIGKTLVFKTGSWRTMRPKIDIEKCKKCGICWKFCPDVSIIIVDEYPVINLDYCKGCGICSNECPYDAIVMVEEESE